MSWTASETSIKSVLTTNGYTETSNIYEAAKFPSSRKHKGYSLTFQNFQTEYLSGNGVISSAMALLEVSYIAKDRTDYSTQVAAWENLLIALKTYVSNNPQDQSFEIDPENGKYIYAKVLLYFQPTGC